MAAAQTALPRLAQPSATSRVSLPRRLHRIAASTSSAGAGARRAYRWLRADVRDVTRLELRSTPRPVGPHGTTELRDSLAAWAVPLRRRRALVIARRHLTAALGVVIVAELVLLLLGDDRHAWWLLAPLALALVDAVIALRRPVPLDTVAQMLDRRLALHDLLVTARQILGEQAQPLGLGALVVDEARAAAAASHATVRVTSTRARREWLSLLAGAAVLALLAALPGLGGAPRHRAAARAQRVGAPTAAHAPAKAKATLGAARRAPVKTTSSTPLARPPLAVTSNGSPRPAHAGFSPYGYGGTSLSAKQLAREGLANPPTQSTKALGALAISESGPGTGSTGSSPAASSGGAAGKGTSGGTASTPTSSGGASASAGGALTPAASRSASAPQIAGTKQAGTGAGGAGSGSSPAGGNAAGSAPGSTALANGLVPLLATGTSGLPLQAGYAPSSAQRSSGGEGVSQTPNGGGSGGRSAHASAGAGGSVSAGVSIIPPTFNSTPPLEQGVLSSYFGSANQLVPRNW